MVWTTQAGPSPVQVGVEQARQRLERAGVELSDDAVHGGVDLAVTVLENQAPEAPARAQELFVEQVVVASAMRDRYDEPPLQPVEVNAFLGVVRWFFNSLWHEDL